MKQFDTYYYSSGRAALYQILRSIKNENINKVFLPDYLCHTIIDAIKKAGYDYCFYELDGEFKATVQSLENAGFRDGDIILMINYFGIQNLESISKLIKVSYPSSILIEDDVQAYYAYIETNHYVDYKFTSLRKTFAIPDGGLVCTKHIMPEASNLNTFASYKIEAGILKYNREHNNVKDEHYLALFKEGEIFIDYNYDSIMSHDSKELYAGTDIQKVKKQRQNNASYLIQGLESLSIKPLMEIEVDSTPLFIPIYLKDRDKVRYRMFENEIYCPIHWPIVDLELKKGKEMVEHELSLIVDQRYSENDMNMILDCIRK